MLHVLRKVEGPSSCTQDLGQKGSIGGGISNRIPTNARRSLTEPHVIRSPPLTLPQALIDQREHPMTACFSLILSKGSHNRPPALLTHSPRIDLLHSSHPTKSSYHYMMSNFHSDSSMRHCGDQGCDCRRVAWSVVGLVPSAVQWDQTWPMH